jgi:hypothetical protein
MSADRLKPDEWPIAELMQAQIERWQKAGDTRSVFLDCYRLMTVNVLAELDQEAFADPDWVRLLLHRFADYYFDALTAYEKRPSVAPPVWQAAFDGARSTENLALQVLLLGVNAHINYDLVLTLVDMLQPEWATLTDAQRAQRYADHCHINEVIGCTIDVVQDQIIEPSSPAMDIVDTLFGPLDEWLTSRLITNWREEVWQNAMLWLEAADVDQQEEVRRQVETATLKRAEAILLKEDVLSLRHLF